MCARLFSLWFVFLWLCLSAGAPQAEEQERWYLISESELRGIETSLERLEADRRNWESQARELRNEAGSLNNQLAEERERYRTLDRYFNRYEREQSTLLSLRNGEIAGLEQQVSDKAMEAESYKWKYVLVLAIVILLASAVIAYIVWRILWK